MEQHITVCAATLRRPHLLKQLLESLSNLETGDRFTYSVLIVDNDSACSARGVVEKVAEGFPRAVEYFSEPEQNISLARNCAVRNVKGDFIAFIDDDEMADKRWLLELHKAMETHGVDGALGPVKPRFDKVPPEWVIRGRMCERKSFPSGTLLRNSSDTRTGNVLFRKAILEGRTDPFDPAYGRTGGGDVQFFKELMRKGYRFAWCNEGVVYETVPPNRYSKEYFIHRAFLRGYTSSQRDSFTPQMFLKTLLAGFLYTAILPFARLAGMHVYMPVMVKEGNHVGRLLGYFGIQLYKERNFDN